MEEYDCNQKGVEDEYEEEGDEDDDVNVRVVHRHVVLHKVPAARVIFQREVGRVEDITVWPKCDIG